MFLFLMFLQCITVLYCIDVRLSHLNKDYLLTYTRAVVMSGRQRITAMPLGERCAVLLRRVCKYQYQ